MNYVRLKEQLKTDEGFSATPYKDSVGKLTIGYGRNLDDVQLSLKEADYLLETDINKALLDAEKAVDNFYLLDDVRQEVIINMVFNMGLPRFKGFKKTIKLIENNEFEKASKEMLNSKWANQVGRRALKLSTMMKVGKL